MSAVHDRAVLLLREAAYANRRPKAWEMGNAAYISFLAEADTSNPVDPRRPTLMGLPVELRKDIAGWCLRTV